MIKSIKNELVSLDEKKYSLEDKLLQFYIMCELVWSFVNAAINFAIRMPIQTILTFAVFFVGLALYWCVGILLKQRKLFSRVYFAIVLITRPIIWYFCGGTRTSANILFVGGLILFVMCLRGKSQKVYILLSLMSTSMSQNLCRRLENPVFPMDDRQYAMGGAVLGLTTSLLIVALLLKQKNEYAKERDAAIESEKSLEKSNSLQKNFLANMSHEIRSPIGIVMGFNTLIKDSSDLDQIHEYSNNISRAGSTLLTVINDILDYSKIESGKLDIIEDDYDFNDMMSEIRTDIALKCEEKGLKLVTEFDKDIPKMLYGDNIRIKQCLLNVLSNAVKYTEKGVVTFLVNGVETEGDRYKIRFVIKDTGKGISEEAIPNLYSAFQRLDEGMNRGIEGTGLGMAITKNLLDEMNGTIDVESQLGVGSTFTIELWQEKGKAAVDNTVIDRDENLEGIKVLVVDDAALNLTLVRKLLTKEGAQVHTIDNGKDCLADVEVNKYDVILLDHMMPDLNGVEVFERIKENGGINRSTPIIMLTANAMTGAMKEYMDMGFDGYLSKPIAPQEMKETILRLTRV